MSERVVCFDLDDTLYKEKEYLCSAFGEVAAYVASRKHVDSAEVYNVLMKAFEGHRSPFQEMNALLRVNVPVTDCLKIYREHRPNIQLSEDVVNFLQALKNSSCILGLITDGRSVTQRNKVKALGLERFFTDENIIISEEFGTAKPSERNYSYFMDKYPGADFYYVGDNLGKDFIAPNRLGWTSICLLDNGNNIHHQDFSVPMMYKPTKVIGTLGEMLNSFFYG